MRISGEAVLRMGVVTLAVAAVATSAAAARGAALTVQEVDTSGHPQMRLRVALPAELLPGEGERPRISVAENGRDVGDVTVSFAEAQVEPASVVLVIDTSGSMRGAPLDNAREAARRFVDVLGEGARVAVLTFADDVSVRARLSADPSVVDSALSGMRAHGETAVYDALVAAARLVPASQRGRASIVLLSDGTDTVSGASLGRAIDEVKRAGVPVYAVALKSPEFNPKALAIIAKDSGGRMLSANASDELGALFEGIARELRDSFMVEYTSLSPATKDVEVDVVAQTRAGAATAAFAYANPRFADLGAADAYVAPVLRDDPRMMAGAISAAFAAVALLVVGVSLVAVRPRTGISQLHFYDQTRDQEPVDSPGAIDGLRSRVVDAVGYVAGRRGLTRYLSTRLEQAGLPLRPAEYMTAHIVAVVLSGFVTHLLLGRFVLSVLAIILTTVAPMAWVGIRVDRRRTEFEAQLPDVLSMIAGSLRGGWGIQQAIDLVVQEAMPPASVEFKRVQTETRLGLPLERSLMEIAERMDSDDFRAVASAIAIQRDVGGNLAEVLDVVSATVRERAALRRQVHALTAEGRLSAIILIVLPIVEAVALSVLSPGYLEPLYTTFAGGILAVTGLVLMVAGSFWLARVTKIEV